MTVAYFDLGLELSSNDQNGYTDLSIAEKRIFCGKSLSKVENLI